MLAQGWKWALTTIAASVLTLGLVACGSSSTSGTHNTAVPKYKPSTVVSQSSHSTVLHSPDSVTKVGDFYSQALTKDGWQIRTKSTSSYHASFVAHRTGEGATVSVYPSGSGTGISIATHKE